MLSIVVLEFLGTGLVLPVQRGLPPRGARLHAQRRRAAARAATADGAAGRRARRLGDRPARRPADPARRAGAAGRSATCCWRSPPPARSPRWRSSLNGIAFGMSWPAWQSVVASVIPPAAAPALLRRQLHPAQPRHRHRRRGRRLLRRRRRRPHLPGDLPRRRRVLPPGAAAPARAAAPRRRPGGRRGQRRTPPPMGYLAVLRSPAMATMTLLSFVSSFVGYSQLNAGMPAYARGVGEISTRALGLAFAANTLVIVLLQLVVLQRIEGRRRTRVIAVMGVVWACSWVLLGFSGLVPGTARRHPAGRGLRLGLRLRRDPAPADDPGAGQRPGPRPPARPLQRAELGLLPAGRRHRPADLGGADRPRPRQRLHRPARRRLPGLRPGRRRPPRAPARPAGQRRPRGRDRRRRRGQPPVVSPVD